MAELLIQFSTSTAFASSVIRRLTRSRFSHVGFLIEGYELGASGKDKSLKDPGGIQMRKLPAWPYLCPPLVASVRCTDYVKNRTLDWARQQIGAPFDKLSLWHFLRDRAGLPNVGRDWRDPNQWFCSEYVLRALEFGGLFTYPLIIQKDVVSPNDVLLLINSFMDADNILQFT